MESQGPSSTDPAESSTAHRRYDDLPPARRARMERLAFLLDDAFRIPGTQRRVGLDALIGLLPGVGDAAGMIASSYLLYEGARLGVTLATLLRMAFNIGVEAVVGLIPGLGDLFGFAFKANNRNLRLIEHHLDDAEATRRSSRTVLTIIAATLVLVTVGLIIGGIWLIGLLVNALGSAG